MNEIIDGWMDVEGGELQGGNFLEHPEQGRII